MNSIQSILVEQFSHNLEMMNAEEQLKVMKHILERYSNGERDFLCTNIDTLKDLCSRLHPITLSIVVMNVMDRELFDVLMNSVSFRNMLREKFHDKDELAKVYNDKNR